MRSLTVAVAAAMALAGVLAGVLPGDGVAWADDGAPAYVSHTEWVHWGDLSSLRVYPTPIGRGASGRLGDTAEAETAWAQVLASAPDADIPGMHEQFLCHWQFAEHAEPGKTSWNLEPWRPVVGESTMIASGCNPGGTEEPF